MNSRGSPAGWSVWVLLCSGDRRRSVPLWELQSGDAAPLLIPSEGWRDLARLCSKKEIKTLFLTAGPDRMCHFRRQTFPSLCFLMLKFWKTVNSLDCSHPKRQHPEKCLELFACLRVCWWVLLFEELLLHVSDLFEGARNWARTAQLVKISGMAVAQSASLCFVECGSWAFGKGTNCTSLTSLSPGAAAERTYCSLRWPLWSNFCRSQFWRLVSWLAHNSDSLVGQLHLKFTFEPLKWNESWTTAWIQNLQLRALSQCLAEINTGH